MIETLSQSIGRSQIDYIINYDNVLMISNKSLSKHSKMGKISFWSGMSHFKITRFDCIEGS